MKLVRFRDSKTRDEHLGLVFDEDVIECPLPSRGAPRFVSCLEDALNDVEAIRTSLETISSFPNDPELRDGMMEVIEEVRSNLMRRLHGKDLPFIIGYDLAHGALRQLDQEAAGASRAELADRRYPLAEVELLAPIHPASFRDFYAFEEHVRNARRRRGLEMVPEWYDAPAFYFSNIASILGPGAAVRKPPDTQELDYELEIAVVIGKEGRDIPVAQADEHIAGFTILNDWSARDIQRREMKVGLGPAKGKDFATSLGPYLVTPDELEKRVLRDRSRGKRYNLTMTASVNGREYSRGNARDMHWTFAELIAHASRNTLLRPGDLIGSGTVGTGCIVEFPEGTYPWLQAGDLVRLEIEGLGVLENAVTSDA